MILRIEITSSFIVLCNSRFVNPETEQNELKKCIEYDALKVPGKVLNARHPINAEYIQTGMFLPRYTKTPKQLQIIIFSTKSSK